MGIIESLGKRRTYYNIGKDIPVSYETIEDTVRKVIELVPDAFNMHSQRVVIVEGEKHDELWDGIYTCFGGQVSREKIDSFKAGAGTILYFIDDQVVATMQEQFKAYAENFPVWANQANGMAQFSVWCALEDLQVGASLQHYNPVIDDFVEETFNIPSTWRLIAQMPFGSIEAKPDPKPTENINERVWVEK